MNVKTIALIGFGEVGQALAEDLQRTSRFDLRVFDILNAEESSKPSHAAKAMGLTHSSSAAGAARGAEVIISAVTAEQTEAAAHATSAGISDGAYYFDLNSASPAAKTGAAHEINKAGGRYVEASVMSPIFPARIASPILLGGSHAREFEAIARNIGFSGARFYSELPGKTAAAKLCRSVMIKGIEALLTESLLSARYYGVEDMVLASLDNLVPLPDWPDKARYMISRAIEHGTRRAEEMREAAKTVSEAGLDPLMSAATAARQDWASGFKSALDEASLHAMLDAVRLQMSQLEKSGRNG